LGIVRANPIEYVERYGSSLKRSMELPTFVKDIRPPAGIQLASESNNSDCVYELEGDIYALNLVDLEREGLVEYKYLLKQIENIKKGCQGNIARNRSNHDLDNQSNLNSNNANTISNNDISITSNSVNKLNKSNSVLSHNLSNNNNNNNHNDNDNVNSSVLNNNISLNNNSESNLKTRSTASSTTNSKYQPSESQQKLNSVPISTAPASSVSQQESLSPSPPQSQSPQEERSNDLFDLIDIDANNTISLGEAEKLFERLTNRLGRRYGENEVKEFFSYIDLNEDGRVDFSEFRRAFQEQI
jgi:hypothetical protein